MNPLRSVGLILDRTEGAFDFLGSCFAFRQPTHYLTTTHCLKSHSIDQIGIIVPLSTGRQPIHVETIEIHPKADISILTIHSKFCKEVEPFWDFVGNLSLGEEFFAFGYPEDIFGKNGQLPTSRLFKGHFQRFMHYESRFGYIYDAGELNIGAPAGLSGGPVFRPGAPVMVTGLVTENLESTTVLHSIEEVQEGGNIRREHFQQVINYGIALLLRDVADWLDTNVPERQRK